MARKARLAATMDQMGIIRWSSFTVMDCGSRIGNRSAERGYSGCIKQLNTFLKWTDEESGKFAWPEWGREILGGTSERTGWFRATGAASWLLTRLYGFW